MKVVCENKDSKFYGVSTTGLLCSPCFTPKKLSIETTVEYVGFGD